MDIFPITKKEFEEKNWKQADFILVTGDAYVDHPSFGAAIIARTLERFGYKICIIAQPRMDINDDFSIFGAPKYGFLVTAGNIDSMVNHYYVSKKRRKKDEYSPSGAAGKRPDRATIKYSHKIKTLFPNSPIIIGGIEASLRRLAHYDYWDNKVRRSILLDSKADLLIYGMAENTIVEVAQALESGLDIKDIIYINGTVYKTKDVDYLPDNGIHLPSYDEILDSKKEYANSFKIQHKNNDFATAKPLIETYKNNYIVQNAPSSPLTTEELDSIYALPYTRTPHPIYKGKKIPSIEEVQHSVIANRGCFGGCNFCALTHHQGKIMQSRSKESIIKEVKQIVASKEFKGYIHDVGGPTANFYKPACNKQTKHGSCPEKDCIGYKVCNNLEVNHSEYLDILRELRNIDGIKKVFVRSGLRFDYIMYDKDKTFFNELVEHHISGQLKIAPEHIDNDVLKLMGKPNADVYYRFIKEYEKLNKKHGKNQFVVPYLMSSHPGSTIESAIKLAEYLRDINYHPKQVQDFYPTPSTLSTTMFYTGINPLTGEEIYIPKTYEEKQMQRALIQFRDPKNKSLVRKALLKANRYDLIGNKKTCLIKE